MRDKVWLAIAMAGGKLINRLHISFPRVLAGISAAPSSRQDATEFYLFSQGDDFSCTNPRLCIWFRNVLSG
jgi:hypothetical protein